MLCVDGLICYGCRMSRSVNRVTKFRLYNIQTMLLALLFALGLFSAGVHAAEYGNGPHQHHGKLCVLAVTPEDELDGLAILPTDVFTTFVLNADTIAQPFAVKPISVALIVTRARDPPNL